CSATLSVVVSQPTALTISATHTDVLCRGGITGTITTTPAGGTPPLTYLWSDGASTQNRPAIASGGYVVTVTDSHTCTATVYTLVSEPTAQTISEQHA